LTGRRLGVPVGDLGPLRERSLAAVAVLLGFVGEAGGGRGSEPAGGRAADVAARPGGSGRPPDGGGGDESVDVEAAAPGWGGGPPFLLGFDELPRHLFREP